MDLKYTIEKFEHKILLEEYISNYHHPEEVWGNCRACDNYGKQWSCPPFDFNVVERLSRYNSVLLMVVKITLHDRDLTQCEIDAIFQHERIQFEYQLLELERTYHGLASTLVGQCVHCGQECCSRLIGRPCRHPDLVRPSLEAYGFDVSKTLSDFFNIELQWNSNGHLPEYLILSCGLFLSCSNSADKL